ncbi:MAG: transporter permease [Acidobacteria bacterium]|nr:transporter permease [Acidobacteriota bacterium]
MNTLRLALRMLLRDWRAGELRVLIFALSIAVASVGTVGFFADRVKGALTRQANLLLGADVLVTGDRPLPPAFADEALRRGLATTPAIKFNSMVQPGGAGTSPAPVLADVKAVAAGYPLRGAIVLADPGNADGVRATGIPARGEAWPDTRLAARLGVQRGDTIAVGDAMLKVTAIVQQEPEVASGLLAIGPRLLVNLDDVPATNLLQPGNRAAHRLLVADASQRGLLEPYLDWLQKELKPGQRMENVRDLRPEVRQTLERAEKFLGLAALVAVILAAVAIALAASRYLRRHLDTAAMLRCFGAAQRRTLTLFVAQFAVLGVAAGLAGVLVGLAGQELLVRLLRGIAAAELPPPALLPGVAAFGTGVLLLFGFALPPLVALSSVPPLRVLRRDLPRPRPSAVVAYGLGAAVIALLVGWQAQDATAAAIMIGGMAGLLAAAALAAWALIALLKRLPQRGVTWRFGLANLRRRPLASSLQIGALALGLMALLLLTVVRGDLMTNWRQSLPPDAPNHFVINVLSDQVDGVRAALRAGTGADVTLYPMVRGRLVAVNGKPLDTTRFDEPRARRLAEREFNLSWAKEMPATNRLVAGTFWTGDAGSGAGLSMEEGIAKSLRLGLGDTLTYDIAGTPVSAPITSLRKVDWDSFRPNFFTLFPPGVLESMPQTWLGAVRLSDGPAGAAWLGTFVRDYPNVLVVDVGEIIRQVQTIMDQVARAVEFVFLFTLAGGLLVLQAAIAATQDERRFDAAVLRTLGASTAQLNAAQIAEFLVLGALAGLLAAGGATAVGYVLADRVFQIPFSANPLVWLIGVAGGAGAVTLAGWLGTRGTTRSPPLAVIRQLG